MKARRIVKGLLTAQQKTALNTFVSGVWPTDVSEVTSVEFHKDGQGNVSYGVSGAVPLASINDVQPEDSIEP